MDQINRRKFLISGTAGAAGLMVAGTVRAKGSNLSTESEIIYRTLGKTGLKVPVVSMGVMRADNPGLVVACMDNGINFFDTANGYQNGRNEEMLGTVLKDYPRDSFIMTTKVKPAAVDRAGLPTEGTTAGDFEAKFNTSLQRLQMDYVDILYVHDVSTEELTNYEPILKLLRKLKSEGKVRFIGISTHKNEPQVIDFMIKNGEYDVVLTSYNFKQDHKDQVGEAISRAGAAGLGVVAMKTMAGGFLDRERTQPVNPSAALKWALSNESVHTAIPGLASFDHLQSALPVLGNLTMSDKEKSDIMLGIAQSGLYCNACQVCVPTCSKHLPIPEIMRAYMYAYGYGSPIMAYNLLSDSGTVINPCDGCDECTVTCTNRFDIKGKILDVSRLTAVPQEFLV